MPLFEFRCNDCEQQFETLVLNPEESVTCAKCSGSNIEKQFSPFGIKSDDSNVSTASSGAGCGCTPVSCGCGVGH